MLFLLIKKKEREGKSPTMELGRNEVYDSESNILKKIFVKGNHIGKNKDEWEMKEIRVRLLSFILSKLLSLVLNN